MICHCSSWFARIDFSRLTRGLSVPGANLGRMGLTSAIGYQKEG
jgi:hypothetical protein